MEANRVRQVTAAVVGVLIIIALVLLARWTGDRIRERFSAPKRPPAVGQPAPVPTPVAVPEVQPAATYSAIPATGPADFGYFLIGLIFFLGIIAKINAKNLLRY